MLLRRVQHFTRGVLFGSREFVNRWFDGNRDYVKGRSQTTRKTGARPIGKASDWGGLSSFRKV